MDSEEGCDIDVELLITLVEERPQLWNKTHRSYKCRADSQNAWRDICRRLNPAFKRLSETDKAKYRKEIIKKWVNLKDRQVKYLKKLMERTNIESRGKKVKKYIHGDRLAFLERNLQLHEETDCCGVVDEGNDSNPLELEIEPEFETVSYENESSCELSELPHNTTKNKQLLLPMADVEKSFLEQDDRHMSFFKGILPSVRELREEEVIPFQMGVLSLLQDLRNSRSRMASTASCSGQNYTGNHLF